MTKRIEAMNSSWKRDLFGIPPAPRRCNPISPRHGLSYSSFVPSMHPHRFVRSRARPEGRLGDLRAPPQRRQARVDRRRLRARLAPRQAVSDWDVATDARPKELMKIFPRAIPTGLQHGTVTVVMDGQHYEVTTLRGETTYTDGRRPDAVHFVDDIVRRSRAPRLHVNAIAVDPAERRARRSVRRAQGPRREDAPRRRQADRALLRGRPARPPRRALLRDARVRPRARRRSPRSRPRSTRSAR